MLLFSGQLRFGSVSSGESGSHAGTIFWRHFACVTPAVLAAAIEAHDSVEEIPGVAENDCAEVGAVAPSHCCNFR